MPGAWWLDDVEARQREAPDSFFIPSAAKRHALQPGDEVKLIFRFALTAEGIDGERMWVEVVEARDGRYDGRLDNVPENIPSLRRGDLVSFGPEHVAAYLYSAEELGYEPGHSAWVRRESAVPRGPRPGRVSMRPPELRASGGDSGWILDRGDEQGAEVTDAELFDWSELGWLTDLHPELEPVFRAGEGDWCWDEAPARYRRL